MSFKSGFLIVLNFNKLYERYVGRYKFETEIYAVPIQGKSPADYRIKYRGMDRDSISGSPAGDMLADIRLYELEEEGKSEEDFLFEENDAFDVFQFLDNEKEDYEIIWIQIFNSGNSIPQGFKSIGFEPAYFYGGHFSAICDCMLIPRWHGTDKEGVLFKEFFNQLNCYGLFDNPVIAKEFLNYYLSFDWTERGDFEIVEVFVKEKLL